MAKIEFIYKQHPNNLKLWFLFVKINTDKPALVGFISGTYDRHGYSLLKEAVRHRAGTWDSFSWTNEANYFKVKHIAKSIGASELKFYD